MPQRHKRRHLRNGARALLCLSVHGLQKIDGHERMAGKKGAPDRVLFLCCIRNTLVWFELQNTCPGAEFRKHGDFAGKVPHLCLEHGHTAAAHINHTCRSRGISSAERSVQASRCAHGTVLHCARFLQRPDIQSRRFPGLHSSDSDPCFSRCSDF